MKTVYCAMFLLLLVLAIKGTSAQVCSPPGQLCARTTDCCRGCCEHYTCVERPFPCSPDLVGQPGSNTCRNYYCPPHQYCYLREICPPENPCPRQPVCRPSAHNNSYNNHNRNTAAGSKDQVRTWILLTLISVMYYNSA